MYENGPKLNYVVIAMISLVIIVLILLGIIIFKKDDCDCSKYINNCNNQNTNNDQTDNNDNNEKDDKQEDTTDYISIAKNLYDKAADAYWSFLGDRTNINPDDCIDEYTCYLKDYDSITNPIFTENGKKQLDEYHEFKISNGKRYSEGMSRGDDITFIETGDFVIKYNTDNKITFNVTNKYCALEEIPEDIKTCSDVARVTDEFIIVKENNNWKVESFELPY